MENSDATKRLLVKMAEATLKRRFLQFSRKYNKQLVRTTWAEISRKGGINLYLSKWHWDTPTKIADALDSLEAYCDSIEAVIRDQDKKKGKKNI